MPVGRRIPAGIRSGPRWVPYRTARAKQGAPAFQKSHGPALKHFQHELAQRRPQIRHIGIGFEDDNGRLRGGIVQALDEAKGPDGEFTHVMVRLKAAELEIVDTLITAGIANNRAEAIRWALTRIAERSAYAQLREHTRDIERLKNEL